MFKAVTRDFVFFKNFKAIVMIFVIINTCLISIQAQSGKSSKNVPDSLPVLDLRAVAGKENTPENNTKILNEFIENVNGQHAEIVVGQGEYNFHSVSVPHNIVLKFAGGRIVADSEAEIKINGKIIAGFYEIFDGKGKISGAPKNLVVYPQWFGAKGDGVTDDSEAFQDAADLASKATGKTLFIPEGDYVICNPVLMRCNVNNEGVIIQELVIDDSSEELNTFDKINIYKAKNNPCIKFCPDFEPVELLADRFYGIKEGALNLPFKDYLLTKGGEKIKFSPGDVIKLYYSDFFSDRAGSWGSRGGAYPKEDICLITSQTGDVFPEFAFSYEKPENCPEWSEDAKYSLGDYVKLDGKIFKATLPSGKSTLLRPNKNKQITIGAVKPQDAWKTWHHFEYNDGLKDKVVVWRRLDFSAFLMREDFPLSVDNLKIDIRIKNNDGMVRRIPFGSLYVNRSNMTFNNLEINVTQREAACQQLLCVRGCVNLEFNRCRFSGATYPGLGYNILNRNCALVKYTDCISVESRKGMDGRHGKNIHVTGGLYNKIADHYGRNLVIENAYFTGRVAYVPGRLKFSERLEMKDLAFRETHALGFAGANLRVENCTFNGDGGVFWVRDDMKNFYGNIIFKNIRVNCDKDVNLFTHRGGWHNNPRLPEKILIENASANPGKLNLYIGKGFKQYDSSTNIINCRNIGYVFSSGKSVYFRGCEFDDCTFKGYSKSLFGFWNCLFKGKAKAEGLKKRNIISDSGNISESGKPGLPLYSASEK